jgi:hypothetical protein
MPEKIKRGGFGEKPKTAWSTIENALNRIAGITFTDNAMRSLKRNLQEGNGGELVTPLNISGIRQMTPEAKNASDQQLIDASLSLIRDNLPNVKGISISASADYSQKSITLNIYITDQKIDFDR